MTWRETLADSRVAVDGEGPPLVLVHGVGCDLTMWDDVMPALEARYRVIRYDTLGHGETPLPAGEVDLGSYAAQLQAVVSAVGLERFALVGFSMGVPISQLFAMGHSQSLAGLVLMNGVYDRTAEQIESIRKRVRQARAEGTQILVDPAMDRWLSPEFRAARPDQEQRIRKRMADNKPENFLAAYNIFAEADPWVVGKLGAIACPTLVTTAQDDPGSVPAMSEAMAGAIPGARCEIMAGLRHMPMIEGPEVVSSLLLGFLDALPSEGTRWR
ncbi:MAG: alpha/beta fold hydrolase [Alphaproteobacteria bacterium]|jgi:(E)-2-((N-methylformamido)methylene)succinate hydrolase|nr:alpha/beta fold hydrolase [Rhodospirillaceae bacterium]MDG2481298.1 alpha/beta fold hydrolase [Alphaproteobacteria bacterium]MBT6205593.1 alpha/beta fold hydrolase [Rhodospirillaceae bacterium]MBT6512681.1 alpha/beta fold hydrolase [Rhodospirillaceae bacterium]MBT7615570.1 alpha/beta fold hydrolase [Rhodospirillaceae bacterium]